MRVYTLVIKETPSDGGAIPQILDRILRTMPENLKRLHWRILDTDVITLEGNPIEFFKRDLDRYISWRELCEKIAVIDQVIDIEILGTRLDIPQEEIKRNANFNDMDEDFVRIELNDSTEWRVSSNDLEMLRQLIDGLPAEIKE